MAPHDLRYIDDCFASMLREVGVIDKPSQSGPRHKVEFTDIIGDGNCFYRAIAVSAGDLEENHAYYRRKTIKEMKKYNEKTAKKKFLYLPLDDNGPVYKRFGSNWAEHIMIHEKDGHWACDIDVECAARALDC